LKLSSVIDLDASTITNKSMFRLWQGTPVKVIFGSGFIVGCTVGRTGAVVGRVVGARVVVVGIMHCMFGQAIPALSTQYCSFNVPNFPVTPSFDAIQVKQVSLYKLRPKIDKETDAGYLNGDTHSLPLELAYLRNQHPWTYGTSWVK
jgi:hypothetical protein